MLAAMAMLEMDVAPPPSPVTAANSIEELLAYFMEAEAGFKRLRRLRCFQHARRPPGSSRAPK